MDITVGTDPEVFFVSNYMDPFVYPAGAVFNNIGLEHPVELETGQIIVDGAAMEYQPRPAFDATGLVGNLRELIAESMKYLGKWAKGADSQQADIAFRPELPIDLEWCERDPELAQFGCDPDLSAWGDSCRPATVDAGKHPWRYAGAHIHLGIVGNPLYFREGAKHQMGAVTMSANMMHTIRALDRTVGLASMLIANNKDARRRAIYGRPGVCRYQPHGMEYRTPSNMILRSPELFAYACDLAITTTRLVIDGGYSEFEALVPDEVVVSVLRNGDLAIARECFSRVATSFGLPDIPASIDTNWRVSWLT